ncbi:MAG: box helicase protein, partial [Methanococcus sp.]|nr:box helicase protein [Methanococcus sp.]
MVNLNNSKITNFLSKLSTDSIHKSNIELIKEIPPKNAEYTENNLDLPDNFKEYLLKKNKKLYTHQYSALENVRNGKNILLTTSTASGKTLSFNLPILETLQNDKDATALYIYPTKALTNDQLNNLKNLENELNITLKPEIYDGDTPNSKRKSIREKSRIILTNPHELHQVLQYNPKWMSFFKNLKYIVIDEAHTYRGIFGSNISFLIRRLRRICEDYGSDPQFILASATLANAKEFSEKLVGLDFT